MSHFPVVIQGEVFADVAALAADIAHRAEILAVPDRNLDPVDWFLRWMREDPSGRIAAAAREAAGAIVRSAAASGDALDMAIQILGSDGPAEIYPVLLDRVERGSIPDSRFYGTGAEIAAKALREATYAVKTRVVEELPRLSQLFARQGSYYEAFDALTSQGAVRPGLRDLVGRWVDRGMTADEARSIAKSTCFFPELVLALTPGLMGAQDDARSAFAQTIRKYKPELAGAVDAALVGA